MRLDCFHVSSLEDLGAAAHLAHEAVRWARRRCESALDASSLSCILSNPNPPLKPRTGVDFSRDRNSRHAGRGSGGIEVDAKWREQARAGDRRGL
jgi:hypothetical protein